MRLFRLRHKDLAEYYMAQKRSRRKFWKLVLFTIFLMYSGVSSTVLRYFICRNIGGVEFLVQDFTITCTSSSYIRFLPVAIVMVLCVVLAAL